MPSILNDDPVAVVEVADGIVGHESRDAEVLCRFLHIDELRLLFRPSTVPWSASTFVVETVDLMALLPSSETSDASILMWRHAGLSTLRLLPPWMSETVGPRPHFASAGGHLDVHAALGVAAADPAAPR